MLHLTFNFEWFFLAPCRDRQYFNLRFQFWNSMSVFRVWMADCEAKAGMLSTISSHQCLFQQQKCKQNPDKITANQQIRTSLKLFLFYNFTFPRVLRVPEILNSYVAACMCPWHHDIVNDCIMAKYVPAHFAQSTESSILYHRWVKFDSPENSEDAFWCQAAKLRMGGILTWICIEVESLKVFPQAILFGFWSHFVLKA